ncbi:MMPL family transporter [Oceanobacter mangrovi]|uniref:MMPL family transporter n=1 Tax=Oceanobacter mangrovi TaxID=2862510 RepID=UPI001C8D094C|nr:hypothetical protein [Oceanobacter mangrovi]
MSAATSPTTNRKTSQTTWLTSWLLVMLAALLFCGWQISRGLQFDTSILALLPAEENSAAADFANNQLADNASQRLILVVSGQRQASAANASQLQQALQQSGLFKQITGHTDASQLQQALEQLYDWRYYHLTNTDRQLLENTPTNSSAANPLVSKAISRLYSPLGGSLAQHLSDDPLQLFDHWREQALPSHGISLQDDWPTRLEQTAKGQLWHRILVADLNGSPFAMGYQQQVGQLLEQLKASVDGLSYTGLIIHASYGAAQAKQEISTIGALSLVGIVLLILLVFRRPSYLLLVFLPLLCGCLLAMATCLLLFERVHIITLAFGASLVGVAIDYSLHYLCHRLEQPGSADDRPNNRHSPVMTAITLGMFSSVLAYLAQAAAPFPGLQQMAVFSAAGLIGAWLTVIGLLPVLTRRLPANPHVAYLLRGLDHIRQRWPRANQPSVAVVVLLLAGLSVWQLPRLSFDDSIVRLQTSPLALLKADQQVNQLAGGVSWSRYLLVSGNSEQQLLQHLQQLQPELDQLNQHNPGLYYQSISQQLAPQQQQQADYQLLANQVYAANGLLDQFTQQLGAAELSAAARADFHSRASHSISPDQWQQADFSASLRHLWLGQFENSYYAVVNFGGAVPTSLDQQLQPLLADPAMRDWLQLIDRPAAISQVLQHYRHSMGWWIALAYAAVLALLALRYRWRAWRIVAGPALASGLTLTLLSLLGMQLTLFNLLALLLVLGIGLDAGIFLINSRNSLYTWLAVAMSALTTLLAFGLLALSSTPVLMYFGATVLCGVVLVWLLTPVFTLGSQDD